MQNAELFNCPAFFVQILLSRFMVNVGKSIISTAINHLPKPQQNKKRKSPTLERQDSLKK